MTARFLGTALLLFAPSLAGCGRAPGENLAARGEALAREKGCASCHSSDGSPSVGPTWKGLYRSKVELSDGSTVLAGQAYLRESMLAPSAKTVKGFPEGLMETVIKPNSLSDEEVGALLAYIEPLR
ncbi:MAG: c-type cytochrome [Candidatus Methylomirabilales bacterium]